MRSPRSLFLAPVLMLSFVTQTSAEEAKHASARADADPQVESPQLRTDIIGYGVLTAGTLHLMDHGLRRDHSGFPFALHATPTTFATFTVLPTYLLGYYYEMGPNYWILADTLIYAATQIAHVALEPPSHQYDTWQKDHVNALNVESPVLGRLSQGVSIALSVALVGHLASSIYDGHVHGFEWTRNSSARPQKRLRVNVVVLGDGPGLGIGGQL